MKIENPRNETELVILFAQCCTNDPDISILSFNGTYPDSLVRWKGVNYKVEFELSARNFYTHRHDPSECDLIICWENDYPESILPVVELRQSNWRDTNIVLTKDNEKLAGYWKKRALESEKRLGETVSSSVFSLESEDEDIIVTMAKNGASGKMISQTIWGTGKYGQFYNSRIRRVLANHGIELDTF